MVSLIAVHPVLNVSDVLRTAHWFGVLGFEGLFVDDPDNPRYAGIGRDGVELHLQWHGPQEWADGLDGSAYRIAVDDPDALFSEFEAAGADLEGTNVEDTDWGTREFGMYDPDRNAIFFYSDRAERDQA